MREIEREGVGRNDWKCVKWGMVGVFIGICVTTFVAVDVTVFVAVFSRFVAVTKPLQKFIGIFLKNK